MAEPYSYMTSNGEIWSPRRRMKERYMEGPNASSFFAPPSGSVHNIKVQRGISDVHNRPFGLHTNNGIYQTDGARSSNPTRFKRPAPKAPLFRTQTRSKTNLPGAKAKPYIPAKYRQSKLNAAKQARREKNNNNKSILPTIGRVTGNAYLQPVEQRASVVDDDHLGLANSDLYSPYSTDGGWRAHLYISLSCWGLNAVLGPKTGSFFAVFGQDAHTDQFEFVDRTEFVPATEEKLVQYKTQFCLEYRSNEDMNLVFMCSEFNANESTHIDDQNMIGASIVGLQKLVLVGVEKQQKKADEAAEAAASGRPAPEDEDESVLAEGIGYDMVDATGQKIEGVVLILRINAQAEAEGVSQEREKMTAERLLNRDGAQNAFRTNELRAEDEAERFEVLRRAQAMEEEKAAAVEAQNQKELEVSSVFVTDVYLENDGDIIQAPAPIVEGESVEELTPEEAKTDLELLNEANCSRDAELARQVSAANIKLTAETEKEKVANEFYRIELETQRRKLEENALALERSAAQRRLMNTSVLTVGPKSATEKKVDGEEQSNGSALKKKGLVIQHGEPLDVEVMVSEVKGEEKTGFERQLEESAAKRTAAVEAHQKAQLEEQKEEELRLASVLQEIAEQKETRRQEMLREMETECMFDVQDRLQEMVEEVALGYESSVQGEIEQMKREHTKAVIAGMEADHENILARTGSIKMNRMELSVTCRNLPSNTTMSKTVSDSVALLYSKSYISHRFEYTEQRTEMIRNSCNPMFKQTIALQVPPWKKEEILAADDADDVMMSSSSADYMDSTMRLCVYDLDGVDEIVPQGLLGSITFSIKKLLRYFITSGEEEIKLSLVDGESMRVLVGGLPAYIILRRVPPDQHLMTVNPFILRTLLSQNIMMTASQLQGAKLAHRVEADDRYLSVNVKGDSINRRTRLSDQDRDHHCPSVVFEIAYCNAFYLLCTLSPVCLLEHHDVEYETVVISEAVLNNRHHNIADLPVRVSVYNNLEEKESLGEYITSLAFLCQKTFTMARLQPPLLNPAPPPALYNYGTLMFGRMTPFERKELPKPLNAETLRASVQQYLESGEVVMSQSENRFSMAQQLAPINPAISQVYVTGLDGYRNQEDHELANMLAQVPDLNSAHLEKTRMFKPDVLHPQLEIDVRLSYKWMPLHTSRKLDDLPSLLGKVLLDTICVKQSTLNDFHRLRDLAIRVRLFDNVRSTHTQANIGVANTAHPEHRRQLIGQCDTTLHALFSQPEVTLLLDDLRPKKENPWETGTAMVTDQSHPSKAGLRNDNNNTTSLRKPWDIQPTRATVRLHFVQMRPWRVLVGEYFPLKVPALAKIEDGANVHTKDMITLLSEQIGMSSSGLLASQSAANANDEGPRHYENSEAYISVNLIGADLVFDDFSRRCEALGLPQPNKGASSKNHALTGSGYEELPSTAAVNMNAIPVVHFELFFAGRWIPLCVCRSLPPVDPYLSQGHGFCDPDFENVHFKAAYVLGITRLSGGECVGDLPLRVQLWNYDLSTHDPHSFSKKKVPSLVGETITTMKNMCVLSTSGALPLVHPRLAHAQQEKLANGEKIPGHPSSSEPPSPSSTSRLSPYEGYYANSGVLCFSIANGEVLKNVQAKAGSLEAKEDLGMSGLQTVQDKKIHSMTLSIACVNLPARVEKSEVSVYILSQDTAVFDLLEERTELAAGCDPVFNKTITIEWVGSLPPTLKFCVRAKAGPLREEQFQPDILCSTMVCLFDFTTEARQRAKFKQLLVKNRQNDASMFSNKTTEVDVSDSLLTEAEAAAPFSLCYVFSSETSDHHLALPSSCSLKLTIGKAWHPEVEEMGADKCEPSSTDALSLAPSSLVPVMMTQEPQSPFEQELHAGIQRLIESKQLILSKKLIQQFVRVGMMPVSQKYTEFILKGVNIVPPPRSTSSRLPFNPQVEIEIFFGNAWWAIHRSKLPHTIFPLSAQENHLSLSHKLPTFPSYNPNYGTLGLLSIIFKKGHPLTDYLRDCPLRFRMWDTEQTPLVLNEFGAPCLPSLHVDTELGLELSDKPNPNKRQTAFLIGETVTTFSTIGGRPQTRLPLFHPTNALFRPGDLIVDLLHPVNPQQFGSAPRDAVQKSAIMNQKVMDFAALVFNDVGLAMPPNSVKTINQVMSLRFPYLISPAQKAITDSSGPSPSSFSSSSSTEQKTSSEPYQFIRVSFSASSLPCAQFDPFYYSGMKSVLEVQIRYSNSWRQLMVLSGDNVNERCPEFPDVLIPARYMNDKEGTRNLPLRLKVWNFDRAGKNPVPYLIGQITTTLKGLCLDESVVLPINGFILDTPPPKQVASVHAHPLYFEDKFFGLTFVCKMCLQNHHGQVGFHCHDCNFAACASCLLGAEAAATGHSKQDILDLKLGLEVRPLSLGPNFASQNEQMQAVLADLGIGKKVEDIQANSPEAQFLNNALEVITATHEGAEVYFADLATKATRGLTGCIVGDERPTINATYQSTGYILAKRRGKWPMSLAVMEECGLTLEEAKKPVQIKYRSRLFALNVRAPNPLVDNITRRPLAPHVVVSLHTRCGKDAEKDRPWRLLYESEVMQPKDEFAEHLQFCLDPVTFEGPTPRMHDFICVRLTDYRDIANPVNIGESICSMLEVTKAGSVLRLINEDVAATYPDTYTHSGVILFDPSPGNADMLQVMMDDDNRMPEALRHAAAVEYTLSEGGPYAVIGGAYVLRGLLPQEKLPFTEGGCRDWEHLQRWTHYSVKGISLKPGYKDRNANPEVTLSIDCLALLPGNGENKEDQLQWIALYRSQCFTDDQIGEPRFEDFMVHGTQFEEANCSAFTQHFTQEQLQSFGIINAPVGGGGLECLHPETLRVQVHNSANVIPSLIGECFVNVKTLVDQVRLEIPLTNDQVIEHYQRKNKEYENNGFIRFKKITDTHKQEKIRKRIISPYVRTEKAKGVQVVANGPGFINAPPPALNRQKVPPSKQHLLRQATLVPMDVTEDLSAPFKPITTPALISTPDLVRGLSDKERNNEVATWQHLARWTHLSITGQHLRPGYHDRSKEPRMGVVIEYQQATGTGEEWTLLMQSKCVTKNQISGPKFDDIMINNSQFVDPAFGAFKRSYSQQQLMAMGLMDAPENGGVVQLLADQLLRAQIFNLACEPPILIGGCTLSIEQLLAQQEVVCPLLNAEVQASFQRKGKEYFHNGTITFSRLDDKQVQKKLQMRGIKPTVPTVPKDPSPTGRKNPSLTLSPGEAAGLVDSVADPDAAMAEALRQAKDKEKAKTLKRGSVLDLSPSPASPIVVHRGSIHARRASYLEANKNEN